MAGQARYHIGFGPDDIEGIDIAVISGDPERAERIAKAFLVHEKTLSTHRGLNSYIGLTPGGRRILSATHGMGAPSLSIVVNELAQVGIRHLVRVGTCGSIQPHVTSGSVVISRASLCVQGAANDIAPTGYPAAASPFWTLALAQAARERGVDWHVGLTASVDTFFEGQERTTTSFNKTLLRSRQGRIDEFQALRVLNFEMESGTLFKMANAYGLGAACICAVVAARSESESVAEDILVKAQNYAIHTAIAAIDGIADDWLDAHHRW